MLTFEEFLKLPREEQNKRYCEMSDHDRFRARMSDWSPKGMTVVRATDSESIRRNKELMEQLEKNIASGKLNLIK